MMLDDMYASDVNERILKQEAVWRERLLPELEWDATEASRVVEELLGSSDVSGVRRHLNSCERSAAS